jgi:hypothetical protein
MSRYFDLFIRRGGKCSSLSSFLVLVEKQTLHFFRPLFVVQYLCDRVIFLRNLLSNIDFDSKPKLISDRVLQLLFLLLVVLKFRSNKVYIPLYIVKHVMANQIKSSFIFTSVLLKFKLNLFM